MVVNCSSSTSSSASQSVLLSWRVCRLKSFLEAHTTAATSSSYSTAVLSLQLRGATTALRFGVGWESCPAKAHFYASVFAKKMIVKLANVARLGSWSAGVGN